MGGSKKQTIGYRYFIGALFEIAVGPVDKIGEIQVDGRKAWVGNVADGQITIDQPELFGGEGREGGVVGTIDIMGGGPAQGVNDYLESQDSPQPGYRGRVSAVLRQVEVGMNPYIKPWAFKVYRILKAYDGEEQWYPEKAVIVRSYVDNTPPEGEVIQLSQNAQYEQDYMHVLNYYGWNSLQEALDSGRLRWGTSNTDYYNQAPGSVSQPGQCGVNGIGLSSEGWTASWTCASIEDNACRSLFTAFSNRAFGCFPINPNSPEAWEDEVAEPTPSSHVGQSDCVDMNGVHILRECIKNPEWGLGHVDADFGASWAAAADTAYEEGMGFSFEWKRDGEIEDFMAEVQAHLDAYVYVDRRTGLWEIKLIRDDYDPDTLKVLDRTNIIEISPNERKDPSDATNAVSLNYISCETGEKAVVSIQDIALVAEAGRVNFEPITMNGISFEPLASRIVERELRSRSAPIVTGSLIANRDADDLDPGDAFIVDYPEYGLVNEICRVVDFEYDDSTGERISVKFSSDVFALLSHTLITRDAIDTTGYRSPPAAATRRMVEEAPYFEIVRVAGQTQADDLISSEPDLGYLNIACESPTDDHVNASLRIDDGAGYERNGYIDFAPSALLGGDLTADPTDTVVAITDSTDIGDVTVGSLGLIGSEMIRIDAVSSTEITIGRGCLDTVPQSHATGDPVIFWGEFSDSNHQEYVAPQAVDVKILPVSGLGTFDINSAEADTVVFDSRAVRPYPVGNLRANNQYGPMETATGDIVLTWNHRDRLTQTAAAIVDYADGDVGPEPGVAYTVEVVWLAQDKTDLSTYFTGSVGTAKTYTVASGFLTSAPADAWWVAFRVRSERDGYQEWQTPEVLMRVNSGFTSGFSEGFR